MTNRGVCAYLSAVSKWPQSLSGTSRAGTISEGYKHTSVYVTTDGVSCNLLRLILQARERGPVLRTSVDLWKSPAAAQFSQKTAPATRVCVGGTHEQI